MLHLHLNYMWVFSLLLRILITTPATPPPPGAISPVFKPLLSYDMLVFNGFQPKIQYAIIFN